MVMDAYTIHMMQDPLSPQILALLACPVCHGSLSAEAGRIRCSECRRIYPVQDGIPILLADRAQMES
jgi:uncharacterized protein